MRRIWSSGFKIKGECPCVTLELTESCLFLSTHMRRPAILMLHFSTVYRLGFISLMFSLSSPEWLLLYDIDNLCNVLFHVKPYWKPGRPLSLLVSINLPEHSSPNWITGITLKRPKPFNCVEKHYSIFLHDWMLDFEPYRALFLLKVFICLWAPATPWMRKITPSKLRWILARMHLICRNGFVLSFWVLQLNGAADKRCQCVFAHLAALLTHWVFQKAFIQGETPHGSNSLCKQNLKQNHPPVNSRQPCTHTYSAQTHFLCPPPPTVHHKNGTFLRKNTQMPGALWCRHTTGLDVVNRLLSCWDSETNYESECASLMERRVEETQAVLTGELELSGFIRKTYPHCDFFYALLKKEN